MKIKMGTTTDNDSNTTQARKKGTSWRFVLFIGKVSLGVAFCCAIAEGWQFLSSRAMDEAYALKSKALEYLAPLPTAKEPTEEELSSLINRVSREKAVDPLILLVIAEKESTGGKFLYHFEPGKYEEISRKGKHTALSDDERRMLASSHGAFHVLGLSAGHFCQLHWSKLYQPLVGARCAASIVQKHWNDTQHIKSSGERIREVFLRYNGSGEMAERYADDAMRKLAVKLYEQVENGGKKL